MATCPACRSVPTGQGFGPLGVHFAERAAESDPDHVRWLNQNISRHRMEASALAPRLEEIFTLRDQSLGEWIKSRFIARFYGERVHPFVLALQHPSRATLLGYVVEHQHFLRQWVRSCGFILARTDSDAVARFELENLTTEFGGEGPDRPSHYELLLRMGESLGLPRARVLEFPPLAATRIGIAEWEDIARNEPVPAAMAAMHGLELVANRNLVRDGARMHYFDPTILSNGTVSPATAAFLREGYDADVGHSEQAIHLVEGLATSSESRQAVQAIFLRSIDLFDDYLLARLERGEELAHTN